MTAAVLFDSYKPYTILFGSITSSIWTTSQVNDKNCPLFNDNTKNRIIKFANTKVDRFFGSLWYASILLWPKMASL